MDRKASWACASLRNHADTINLPAQIELDPLQEMNRLLSLFTVGAVVFLGCLADIPGDVVTSLPGWSGPTPTKQYSGYINISDTKHMHYW